MIEKNSNLNEEFEMQGIKSTPMGLGVDRNDRKCLLNTADLLIFKTENFRIIFLSNILLCLTFGHHFHPYSIGMGYTKECRQKVRGHTNTI